MELKENTYASRGKKSVKVSLYLLMYGCNYLNNNILCSCVEFKKNKHEMIGKEKHDIVGEEM
jgi:hypothetical protein